MSVVVIILIENTYSLEYRVIEVMKILIPIQQLDQMMCKESVPLQCMRCGGVFYKRKSQIQAVMRGNSRTKALYCSYDCAYKSKERAISTSCAQCDKPITVR